MDVQFRRLTGEELKELEKEFVEFLVINGITADDWEKMKKEDKAKAERLVDLFSDVVFEGIFRKTRYLDFFSKNEILSFQCLDERIVLVGIECKNPDIDLTEKGTITSFAAGLPENIKIFQTNKPYAKKREVEMFEMTQKGASISNGELFKKLSLLYAE